MCAFFAAGIPVRPTVPLRTRRPRLTSCSLTFAPLVTERRTYPGRICINDFYYDVLPIEGGYRLTSLKDGAVYDLDGAYDPPVCSCPDCTFRQAPCKHSLGIQQLRSEGSLS